MLVLAKPKTSKQRLPILRRVPGRIKEHDPIRTHKVDADVARFGRQQKQSRAVLATFKFLHEPLPLLRRVAALNTEELRFILPSTSLVIFLWQVRAPRVRLQDVREVA